jgi:hypothetical protein
VQLLLLDLYAAALQLEWVELQHSTDYEIPKIDLTKTLRTLAEKVGSNRYYRSVIDPISEVATEASCGDAWDDLGDIYKDLSYSLIIFDLQRPDSQENAIWQFKYDFAKHWGDHCINALQALHFILTQD